MPPRRQKAESATPSAPSPVPLPATQYPQPNGGGLALPGSTWNPSQIPIDPALQTPQHPVAYYPYPQYQYPPPHNYTPPQTTAPAARATQNNQSNSGGLDTTDLATLNDVLGSAGVDVRAEEEGLQRTQNASFSVPFRSAEGDRSRRQTQVNSHVLGQLIRDIGNHHKVSKIPEDSIQYMGFALRIRLQELLAEMIAASKHRTEASVHSPPGVYEDGSAMWDQVVRRDVGKQISVIERIEREEEMRIRAERKERAEALAAHTANAANAYAEANGGDAMDEDGPKKKRKKEAGPGVTAKNMSDEVRKKMSNAVASQAAGLSTGKYAWMNAGSVGASSSSAPVKAKPRDASGGATPAAGKGWAKPFVKTKDKNAKADEDTRQTITLSDALFVIQKERGHGGGRGAARGWT